MAPSPPAAASGFSGAGPTTHTNATPKLRSACNACHEVKLKCPGGQPCSRCRNKQTECVYSYAARIGKPKGSRNKKTLERLRQAKALSKSETQGEQPSSTVADPCQAIERRTSEGSARRDSSIILAGHSDTDSAEGGTEELVDQDEIDDETDVIHVTPDSTSRDVFLKDKQPFVEEIQSNRTTLRPISSSEDDFMELLAQTNILNDAPDDLRHLSADMFPESLGDVQHLSTSAADSMSWMNSPTKSLLGNTFLTMGDDLQDLFMYSGWRCTHPPPSSRHAFQLPLINQFTGENMGLDYSGRMDPTKSLSDPSHPVPRVGSFTTNRPGSSQERSNFVPNMHGQSPTGVFPAAFKRPSCSCLKLQAAVLCRVHLIDSSHEDIRGDTVLATTSKIVDSCNSLITCPYCATDYKFVLLAIMTVRIMLCWLRGLSMSRPQTDNANMKLTLGEYEISGEEEKIVKNILVARTLEKVKMLLRRLRERVNNVTAPEAGSCREATKRWDLSYIRMCLDHLEKQAGC